MKTLLTQTLLLYIVQVALTVKGEKRWGDHKYCLNTNGEGPCTPMTRREARETIKWERDHTGWKMMRLVREERQFRGAKVVLH